MNWFYFLLSCKLAGGANSVAPNWIGTLTTLCMWIKAEKVLKLRQISQ